MIDFIDELIVCPKCRCYFPVSPSDYEKYDIVCPNCHILIHKRKEKDKAKMKIIDERNTKYTRPKDFEAGDIVLDADGDYYKIHYTEIGDHDFCLESLDDGEIFASSDDIRKMLTNETRLPLIRIKTEDTELHIKESK